MFLIFISTLSIYGFSTKIRTKLFSFCSNTNSFRNLFFTAAISVSLFKINKRPERLIVSFCSTEAIIEIETLVNLFELISVVQPP